MFRQQILITHIIKRFKKTKTATFPHELKKKTTADLALQHFDDFYKSVFGDQWPGIRASLLTEHKYVAVVNNFGDSEKTKESIELNGGINLRAIYEIFASNISKNEDRGIIKNLNIKTDRKIANLLHDKQTTEIQSLYQQYADEGLEKLRIEDSKEPSRVIDATEVVNYKKSLEQTIEEDSAVDYNRMISAEIGIMGLQEFIPATKLKGMEDFIPESEHYQYYKTTVDFPLTIEAETEFDYPKTLDLLTYAKGDISRFARPKRCTTENFSHFLVNGASIFPPLMLNVQAGDRVFDACAAPGGKSFILLQTLLPEMVVCNELQPSRAKRIYGLFKQYLIDFDKNWDGKRCVIRVDDVRNCKEFSSYDKILVDVPCSNDRQSVTDSDNNIFNSMRIKERLQLPELQASLLVHCLQLLKPGGSLVYSTCSLSPIQNDGVVNMALSKVFREYHITATIKDLTDVLRPFRKIFHFQDPKELKYGQLVVPQLPCNFGPMYFCKITRNVVGNPTSK